MPRITRLKRGKMGAKRLDMTRFRQLAQDGKVWAGIAVVETPDGEDSPVTLAEENGVLVDILVDVVLLPENLDMTCRLLGGTSGRGVITLPEDGDEALVCVPMGDIRFMPVITGLLSGNAMDNPSGQGPAQGRTLLVNTEILAHDGSGGAKSVAYTEDLQTIVNELRTHIHPTGVGPSGQPSTTFTDPVGTSIFFAK